jgi:pimeloyl-ACP methyl ester carboxylesterase
VIHFVTHSMGGILVRYYLARHTVPELGRVVMLAPPNQGSEVVDRFSKMPGYETVNGPAGYQLGTAPDSVPNSLGPVTYPVGVIAGTESVNLLLSSALPDPDDGKVSVERTRVEGMADFITVEASHPFIMRDDEAIRQALFFLQVGHFAHDTP